MSLVMAAPLKEMPIHAHHQSGSPEAESHGDRCRDSVCAITAHLQGIALTQLQLLFIVVYSLAVVLHVSKGGSQGHMDDSQLGPWPAQQLRKIQLGTRQ